METTKEKILRLLDTLPEPYNKWAIANYDPSFYEEGAPIDDNNDALGWAFDWEKSPQGNECWAAVRRHLEDGDPLAETKETTQHTPTPWKVNRGIIVHEKPNPKYPVMSDCALLVRVIGKITDAGPESENQANAAFIVKACNNYHESNELIRRMYNLIERMGMKVTSKDWDEEFRDMYNPIMTNAEKLIKSATE